MPRRSTRSRVTGVYPTPQGTYVARLRNPATGREVSRTFKRQQDAKRWREETARAFQSGEYVDPRAGLVPVRALTARWLTARAVSVKPSTLAGYREIVRARIDPKLGDLFVGKVRERHLEEWVAEMHAEGLSASRIKKGIQITRQVFQIAVKEQMIVRNPVTEAVRAPRARPTEIVALTLPEVQSLVAETPDGYRLLVAFLATTGLRVSEAVAVRKKDLTLARGKEAVFVHAAFVEVHGGRMAEGAPKTWHRRHVAIPSHVAEMLRERVKGLADEDLVWQNAGGGPVRPSRLRKVLRKAAVRAGLEGRGVTVKALRSTAISNAIRAGASVTAAQRMAGHQTAHTTLTHYAAYFPDDDAGLRANVNAAWADTLSQETDKTV